jgi:hypothetical protein
MLQLFVNAKVCVNLSTKTDAADFSFRHQAALGRLKFSFPGVD